MARSAKNDETPTEPDVVEDPSLGDPETQVWDERSEQVVDMPSGSWSAALTEAGNLRHKGGLLILAP